MADLASRTLVLQALKDSRIASLATVSSDGVPHAATVVFAVDDDFNIYFVTRENTTKVKNIAANPIVSLSMGAKPPVYVQMRGRAERIDGDVALREKMLSEVARAGAGIEDIWPPIMHIGNSDYILFRVVPEFIRGLDLRDQHIAADEPPFIQIM
ncbi:MAG: pyridoxamine 5'-phosphate oxidase family protein [Patescibacteria group bacterium]